MALVHRGYFGRPRLHVDAASSAVIADTIHRLPAVVDVVVDNRAVVIVVDAAAYVSHGAVVVEVIAVPVAAEVAQADVSVAVVDSAVVADVASPVAGVEAIVAAVPAPVGRRPERAVVGRENPGAGNPVVAVSSPGPVAGGPDVVGAGRGRL